MSLADIFKAIINAFLGKNDVQVKDEEKTAQNVTKVPYNPSNVEGTNMRKSVFSVMVAGEDNSAINKVKAEMVTKDHAGIYPYSIYTDKYEYIITKPA